MEAETYLSPGFAIRQALEATKGWTRFDALARIWMPGRLKGIQVGPRHGTPFLAATQVFDLRPAPRKWLAIEQTADASSRFVQPGTILVTCSGTVGRATIAHAPHEKTLITHDLLRVEPRSPKDRGWLYAFLLTKQTKAMLAGAHYGHVIKHLEESHLGQLPVPSINPSLQASLNTSFDEIQRLRNQAYRLEAEAFARFEQAIGPVATTQDPAAFQVSVSKLTGGRRRLEASYHSPVAQGILDRLPNHVHLAEVATRIWWLPRFARHYGDEGIPYLSADELFTIDGQQTKRILVDPNDSHDEYFVTPGWILMACSGQVYGLNGEARLAVPAHSQAFFSHDLIRIIPNTKKIRAGYLLVALIHRTHGRPLVIRAAYGTSIPHLDPNDVAATPIVRLAAKVETKIADLAEEAAASRSQAESLERQMAEQATAVLNRFVESAL